jgi:hypothetical protein
MSDSEDEFPRLSAEALAALQEFYIQQAEQEEKCLSILDRKQISPPNIQFQEDWVCIVLCVITYCLNPYNSQTGGNLTPGPYKKSMSRCGLCQSVLVPSPIWATWPGITPWEALSAERTGLSFFRVTVRSNMSALNMHIILTAHTCYYMTTKIMWKYTQYIQGLCQSRQ